MIQSDEQIDKTEPEESILTGAQAAAFLGVKVSTIYAYVSRGLLKSVNQSGGRERVYRMLDLLRLRKTPKGVKLQSDGSAPEWTGPLIKSSITEIREDGYYYRGESAIELAETDVPFESVVQLLWEGERSKRIEYLECKSQRLLKKFSGLVAADSDYLDALKTLVSFLELSEPSHTMLDSSSVFARARGIMASMAFSLDRSGKMHGTLKSQPMSKIILQCLTRSRSNERAQALNRALVVCADHELNASTLAARVAASCDAPLHSILLSALGTFSGDLHGARSRQVEDLVRGSLHYKSAAAWLKQYSRERAVPPGFGMSLYPGGDPRGRCLIDTATAANARSQKLKQLIQIVDAVVDSTGEQPTIDCGLAAISFALDLPPGAANAIFAISRTAGWVAHAMEQKSYGGMIRPRARYIGRQAPE